MAQPIPLSLPARDPRAELRSRLENAPVEHAEALLDSYELLQQLHEHGVFQLVSGVLGASEVRGVDSCHAERNHSGEDAGGHQSRPP